MIQSRLYGIVIIFVLHAVTMMLLCPSRLQQSRTLAVWGGMIAVCVGGCTTIIRLVPTFAGAMVALLLAVVLLTGTVFYLSRSPAPQTLFLLLTYMQAFMVAAFISGYLSHRFWGGSPDASAFIRTILQLGIVLACLLLSKQLNLLTHSVLKGWWPINMLAILLLTYQSMITMYLYATAFAAEMQCKLVFLLLVVLVAVYTVFFHTINQMQCVSVARQVELKNQFLLREIDSMQEILNSTRQFRHDQRHHILNMSALARNGELDALLRYLDEYELNLKQYVPMQLCGNLTVDNILSAYGKRAEQNKITVKYDLSVEKELGILDTDMVAILANLMENAVQGCIRAAVDNPFIEVTIKCKVNKLAIQVRNTAERGIPFADDRPKSIHGEGVGISSIISAAERYGGQTDFRCENGVFVCRIVLDLPPKV